MIGFLAATYVLHAIAIAAEPGTWLKQTLLPPSLPPMFAVVTLTSPPHELVGSAAIPVSVGSPAMNPAAFN